MTASEARNEYEGQFPSLSDAIAFEQQVLSAGREFLPACALAVIADPHREAPAEYWQFLIDQWRGQ